MKNNRSACSFCLWTAAFLLLPTVVLAQRQRGEAVAEEEASLSTNGGTRNLQGDVFMRCGFEDDFFVGCIDSEVLFEAALLDSNTIDVPLCSGFVYRPISLTSLSGLQKRVGCGGDCIIDGENFQGGSSAFVATSNSILEFCGLTFRNFQQPVGSMYAFLTGGNHAFFRFESLSRT